MIKKALRLIPMLALAIAVCAAGRAAAEKATVVRAGNLVLRINGGVAPKRLPKGHLAPITLRASGSLATVDGSHPPATKTVTVDFDKHGTINARGLPVCRPGKLQSRDTKAAIAACRPALVGRGRTTVQVAFPEQPPFSSTGPLALFNGGVHRGVTTMYIHAYVSVPTPTAIVTVVKIKKEHKGPYGTRAVARIPKIAGGSGSLTKFAFAIHRTFRRGGRKQSYLLARCANGRFRAHAVLQTSDGRRISGSILRTCRPRG
ncbi:MAG TPA: hypothetical protein VFK14_05725 [Solirubrobacterales bacterium]|nr:hypothetical protein [Solirubrobacterales bacterium]